MAIQHFGSKFVVAYNEAGIITNTGVSEVSAVNVVTTLASQVNRFAPSVSIDAFSRYQVAYTRSTDGSGTGIARRRGLL